MPDPPRAQQLGADHPELHPSGPDDALSSALAGSDPDPDPQFGGGGLTTSSSAPGSSGFDRDGHFERHDPEPNAAGGGGGSLGGLGLTGVATEKPPADVVANGDTRTDGSPATPKPNFVQAFGRALWTIVTSSWINVLLIFVPVGIAVAQIESLKGPVAFSMNAVAIVPLAGLLSFATESVAAQMGDAIGALMNVTFGNAVELIIFM
jgi:Ca2+:H+ antiporter